MLSKDRPLLQPGTREWSVVVCTFARENNGILPTHWATGGDRTGLLSLKSPQHHAPRFFVN